MDSGAVPVVDVAPFFSHRASATAADAVAAAVADAALTVGFFVVVGHGIEPALRRECAEEARAFFARPEAEKQRVAARGGAFGFIPMSSEALGDGGDASARPDLREAFAMGPVANLRPALDPAALSPHERKVVDFCYQPTPWPAAQPRLRSAMERYYEATATLGDGLLSIFGRALGIDEQLLLSKTTHHFSAMALINYPALLEPPLPGQLRCGQHQDSGTLTILEEDEPGLEVRPRGSDEWQGVDCPEEGLIVNVGDLMERWTNKRWTSTPHRVRLPQGQEEASRGRLSIAWFQNLNYDAEISSLELVPDEEPLYESITQGQLFWEREGPQRPGRRTDADNG